ncbi:glycosyltransferase family 21 protein [Jaapia argillacea MUCL 33604]|uniref:Ceramide glucosyltransferase n=1 Tax=Jaapia argillacea MUCL 33604 TaxID=933084 RepID=A0A067QBF1_9AGAM|nr:glycosyltransferase family 21 protein [Jaapia argillacea MUCL 33604]
MASSSTDSGETTSLLAYGLSIIGITWYFILWSIGLLGWFVARRRYGLRPRSPLASAPASSVPGVSILRPLKGLDTNLYENLESTFTQEYPNYEILFCVHDEHDQALSVVRDLLAKYPNVQAKVVIGEDRVGVNPKVNNLMQSYRQAQHDILWVIDSNVLVSPGTLARSVDALTAPPPPSSPSRKRIGLVHHVPLAFSTEPSLGSRVEEAFLNTNHAKMYLAINIVALESCVVGKSNLFRRSDLDRVNGSLKSRATHPFADSSEGYGLAAFGRFLAEDNMIAAALWHELDLRHELSCDVARNAIGNMSLSDYVWRRVRWIRVRKRMVLAATIIEPFTESILIGLIGASSLHYLLGSPPIWFFLLLHFGLWLAVDMDIYASLAGHPVPANERWSFLTAWAVRECLAMPIYLLGIFGDEVEWRGKKYTVLENGEAARVGEKEGQKSGVWTSWLLGRGKGMGDYAPIPTGI